MPYDVTTIGNLLGKCECGKARTIDVQRLAGFADTASSIFDRVNPFSDDFIVKELARRAAESLEEKADQAAQALKAADPRNTTAGLILDGVGVPTWGYNGDLITGVAIVGVLAVGGIMVVKQIKKRKTSARSAPRRKAKS